MRLIAILQENSHFSKDFSKPATTLINYVQALVFIITPSKNDERNRGLKTKIFRFDLESLLYLCPEIQEDRLFGTEINGSIDNQPKLRELITVISRLWRYDKTNHGVRLRVHGIEDEFNHKGEKLEYKLWPHETVLDKDDCAVGIQSVIRGFIARKTVRDKIRIMKENAAAMEVCEF